MSGNSRATGSAIDTDADVTIDDLILAEQARFVERTRRSRELTEQAKGVMPGGVTSSWAMGRPHPLWISHGEGSRVWDVDGNEYVDVHGGYGVNVVGHGNAAVEAAIARRAPLGTHFAQPTEDSIIVAENLAQ
ncbi:MAG: aminotransferase class III-fold pyridoxal phosphate-dependent enzyme, partial [Acidimicrobiia bacterium]|nr:aminotransferase class III-fold pyridoxal phosphate-dependent enzyme [Acidimicrobiia bacterium]